MRRQLPIFDERCLDDIGVAKPCDADWNAMKGDERVRHCPACRLNVYNISAMTRREAAALITAREGRLCVRMLRRVDGTLISQDCRERLRAARRRGLFAFAATLAIICVTQLGLRIFFVRALLDRYTARTPATALEPPPRRPFALGAMGVMEVANTRDPLPPMPVMGEPGPLPVAAPPSVPTLGGPVAKTPSTASHHGKRPAAPAPHEGRRHMMGKMEPPAEIQGEMQMGDLAL